MKAGTRFSAKANAFIFSIGVSVFPRTVTFPPRQKTEAESLKRSSQSSSKINYPANLGPRPEWDQGTTA
jgi:hypothetical protein